MPPLRLGGICFLIGEDDLVFAAPVSLIVHAIWAALESEQSLLLGAQKMGIPQELLLLDAALCAVAVLVDALTAICSAQGAIGVPCRYGGFLKGLLYFRLVVAVPLVVFSFAATAFTMWRIFEIVCGKELIDPPILIRTKGWGPEATLRYAPQVLLLIIVFLRGQFYTNILVGFIAISVPPDAREQATGHAVRFALQLIGAHQGLRNAIVSVVMDLVGKETLSYVLPSDILFGVMLVQAKQMQGLLGTTHTGRSEKFAQYEGAAVPFLQEGNLSLATRFATTIGSASRPPVAFDSERAADRQALCDINHFFPYASGIYGFSMGLVNNSVYPGTSIFSPTMFLRALWKALPCRQQVSVAAQPRCLGSCPPQGPTEGDWKWSLNEFALRRTLAAASSREGVPEPELLYATWEIHGVLKAPPFAVLLDHGRRDLVIVVRGTLNLEDCVADLEAHPTFFDPFGMATAEETKVGRFDDDTGLFAHDAMLACAEDLRSRLEKKGTLQGALGPGCKAYGYNVVVCGHSLGAGVACLLALILYKELGESVRYIGFEPPGGLLSKRIARETARLGWVSAVCANDWISRLSIKALQSLREQVLDELSVCDRSKFQLCLLSLAGFFRQLPASCCFCWPFANMFYHLGGGRLCAKDDAVMHKPSFLTRCPEQQAEEGFWFSELWPPGRLAYFRPLVEKFWFCGLYQQGLEWVAEWAQPEDLQEIILSYRSMELHFPNIIEDAYADAARRFVAGNSAGGP